MSELRGWWKAFVIVGRVISGTVVGFIVIVIGLAIFNGIESCVEKSRVEDRQYTISLRSEQAAFRRDPSTSVWSGPRVFLVDGAERQERLRRLLSMRLRVGDMPAVVALLRRDVSNYLGGIRVCLVLPPERDVKSGPLVDRRESGEARVKTKGGDDDTVRVVMFLAPNPGTVVVDGAPVAARDPATGW